MVQIPVKSISALCGATLHYSTVLLNVKLYDVMQTRVLLPKLNEIRFAWVLKQPPT